LFIIYNKELFHRSLLGVPKVPLRWDPRKKIEKVSNLKEYKNNIAILLLCTEDDNSCYRNVCKMPVVSFALAVVFIIWRRCSENTSQFIPFCLTTTSIITKIWIGPLTILISSCTDLHVDSGSCSNFTVKQKSPRNAQKIKTANC